ncbi:MAG: SIMPL domain-containing protein [Gammaproteobacteria bacterium]
MKSIIAGLFIALGITGSGYLMGSSIKYFKNFDRYVEVKGLSERLVKSDLANWQIGFNLSGNELPHVYKDLDSAQQKVIAFLIKQGFDEAEIQKQTISIIDNYANAYSSGINEKLPRYTAMAGVTVTSKKVDTTVNALQGANSLVESGVLLSNNMVTYSYTDLNVIKTAMLNEALTHAKKAAQEFANNSNSSIGKIRQAGQGLFTIGNISGDYSEPASITKKVRVVTTVQYFLK